MQHSRIKFLETEEDFFEEIDKGIVLVDFFAEWCGPCKMLGTVLENIDYMDILKIDTDKFPNLAMKFGVMSIPTLIFFKDGVEMKKEIGYRTPEEIKELFNSIK